jgi:hypothetical protein
MQLGDHVRGEPGVFFADRAADGTVIALREGEDDALGRTQLALVDLGNNDQAWVPAEYLEIAAS